MLTGTDLGAETQKESCWGLCQSRTYCDIYHKLELLKLRLSAQSFCKHGLLHAHVCSSKYQMHKFVIGPEHLFWQCLVHAGIMWCELCRNERALLLYLNFMHKASLQTRFLSVQWFQPPVHGQSWGCHLHGVKGLVVLELPVSTDLFTCKTPLTSGGQISPPFMPLLFHCLVVCAGQTRLPRWHWECLKSCLWCPIHRGG